MPDLTVKYVDSDGEHELAVPIGKKPAKDLPAAALQLLAAGNFIAADGTVGLPYDDPTIGVTSHLPSDEPEPEAAPSTSPAEEPTPAPSDVTE